MESEIEPQVKSADDDFSAIVRQFIPDVYRKNRYLEEHVVTHAYTE